MSALRKNVASQHIGFVLNSTAAGAPVTAGGAGTVVIDGGAQAACAGTFTHKGTGQWDYAPTQAETNGTSIHFAFTGTGAVQVGMQFFTLNYDTTATAVPANATQWLGGTIPAVNVTGVPLVDLKYTLGTISPATAGSVRADAVTAGVTVTTNNDKTGYTASTVSDKTGYALTSGERTSIADALLDRDMSLGADNGSTTVRTVRQALRALRNKWAVVTGTLSVYKEDDTTASWTSVTTSDGTAQPIISSDPAGP